MTALFVAARIIANPVSNVFQKQLTRHSADPLFIIAATHALLTLVAIPLLFGPVRWQLGTDFWVNMGLCALLAVAGNVLLVHALKTVDLSILGPINSYKAVISLLLGVIILGEIPTVMGLIGVLLILAGSYLVVDRERGQERQNAFLLFIRNRGVQLRFAALGLSATEAIFLKKALLLSNPLTTFVWWSILGLPIAGISILLLVRLDVGREWVLLQRQWRSYLGLGFTSGVMQLSTLLTFGRLQVGYSLALFQLSTLLSVLLGYHYFQESNIRRRLLGSLVMIAGVILIVMFGHSRK